MDFDFIRGSFGHNRRFAWLLGVVIILLVLLEPEAWYTIKPAKEENATTAETAISAKPTNKLGAPSTPPSVSIPAAANMPQWLAWKYRGPDDKCPPKRQSQNCICQMIKKASA